MADKWLTLEHDTFLLPSEFARRYGKCKVYLKTLKQDNLLMYYKMEAGLFNSMRWMDDIHGGWDSPTSFGKGMFTGHWLSAIASAYMADGDRELKARLDLALDVLLHCQRENNGWAFATPEKHLSWLKRGKYAYNPLYACHKTMMGYIDAWLYAGSETAHEIMKGCAEYFLNWSHDISREQMDEIMESNESGGILEIWAQLYQVTGDPIHRELMHRFERPLLYNAILDGQDILTNMHANTIIPEIAAVARCYDATGHGIYRAIVEAFWRQAVEQRGMYATGGQTSGEVWTPDQRLAARLGEMTQEHCTVYNMMKVADALLRWTGDASYADYIERNLLNGVLAQTFLTGRYRDIIKDNWPPREYLVAYFLPLGYGVRKKWGTETSDFWCCHGTAIQANTQHAHRIFYETSDGVALCQYIPSQLSFGGGSIKLEETDTTGELIRINGKRATKIKERPDQYDYTVTFDLPRPKEFVFRIRLPWWLNRDAEILVDGESLAYESAQGFLLIQAQWQSQKISISLPKSITIAPLPGELDTVAFIDGPIVLAGLTDAQYELHGEMNDLTSLLRPYDERGWTEWNPCWRTVNQAKNIIFMPLNRICEEQYNVYFPIRK